MATILLIDDSRFMRKANEMALTRAGYAVLGAGDGEEGLRIAQSNLPDLIVLDMLLPKISGPQLLEKLKSQPATERIPVIVLSSLPQKNEQRLKSAGAAAYFEKTTVGVESGSARLVEAISELLKTTQTGARAGN